MEQGPGGAGTTTGRIASFKERTGGTISYSYPAPCAFVPGWSGFGNGTLTRTTPDGTTTYTAVTSSNFTTTTVLDPGKNKVVYYFYLESFNGQYSTPRNYFLLGKDVYQNTGSVSSPAYTLLSSVNICYNTNTSNCRTTSVSYPVTQRDTYNYIGSTSLAMNHKTELFDSYGNTTSSSVYDYISGQTVTTTITYGSWGGSACGNVGSSIYNRPCDVLTTASGNSIAESRYTYNTKGALKTVYRWTGATWLTSSSYPNSNGTTSYTTNERGLVTNYSYSGICNSLMPTSSSQTINGVLIQASTNWDCNTGLNLGGTDANGNPFSETYDSMLRPSTSTDPTGYETTYSYTATSASSSASFGSSVQNGTTYLDSLGRTLISQVQQGPSSTTYDTVSYGYGFNGPNWQVTSSSPCSETLGTGCGNPTTALMDPLGRASSVSDPMGGTLTTTYTKNDISTVLGPKPSNDSHVKTVQQESDGFGRTSSVCGLESSGGAACGQVDGNSGVLTSYSYSFGAGSSTVQSTRGVQTHTSTSDALGRPLSVTTPEAGTYTSTYDSYASGSCGVTSQPGDLMNTISSSGRGVCFVYDVAHRLTGVGTWTDPVNTCSNLAYDATANGMLTPPSGYPSSGANIIGRVVEATTYLCGTPSTVYTDEWLAYDADGRTTDVWESTPHSGGYYHTTVAYNPNGTVASLSGIPGYTNAYVFGVDGEGRPNTATQGSTTLINGVTYDAASNPTSVLIGSAGDSDSYTYDYNERMKSYTFSVNGTTDVGTLTWNANGTLQKLAIVDGFNSGGSQTCTFTYDDIVRILTDNCGNSIWNQSFSYDQYDNLTKTSLGNATSWNPGYNSANNQISSPATYDAFGEVTYDFNNTYSWNSYGKMLGVIAGTTAANCGTTGNCFTYDAFGNMVERSNNYQYTEMLYSPVGRTALMAGQTVTNALVPLPGGGQMWASGSGGTGQRNYDHMDWLGSARLQTTIVGRTQKYDAAYSPYGELYNTFGTVTQTFTGDLQDSFAGLFDTPARELDQVAGSRWLSPDPAHASWNAYSYPTNPNSETDPSGLCEDTNNCDSDTGGVDPTGLIPTDTNVSSGPSGPCGTLSDPGPCSDPFDVYDNYLPNTPGSVPTSPGPGSGSGSGDSGASGGSSFGNDLLAFGNLFGNLLAAGARQMENIAADVMCAGLSGSCRSELAWSESMSPMATVGDEDVFLTINPSKTYSLAEQPDFHAPETFGRAIAWNSWKVPGSPLLDPNIAPLGGFSVYQEALGGAGEFRTSDHWVIGKSSSMTLNLTYEQMLNMGGQPFENGTFWVFKEPVTGFFPYR
jgi:hypothetical protein